MKFTFNGSYTCFDGHEFMFGKPTTVTGPGTIERLLKDKRFSKVDEPVCADSGVTLEIKPTVGCPKCGRQMSKGLPMHTKYCKGPQ